MTTVITHHPILGPGFAGLRASLWALLLLAVCFVVGLAFTYSDPVKVAAAILALVVLITFFWLSVNHPAGTLCIVVLCQILVPVYIRLPLGIPPGLLMLAVFIMFTAAGKMLRPVPAKPGKYEHLMATVLLIYSAVLLFSIPNEHASMGSYQMYIKTVFIPASLFFAMLATIRTPAQLLNIFRVITIAAVLSGLLGVQEFVTKSNIIAKFLAPEVSIDEDFFLWVLTHADEMKPFFGGAIYRVYSFFTQPLEYSAFMIMAFPFASLMFVTAKTGWGRIMYGLATAIIFAGFIVSFSRGPTLALALVIIFLGIYERRVRPWICAGTAAAAIGLIIYWPVIGAKIADRVTGSDNITLRFSLWKNGISIFLQNPLRGIGYGSYPNYHIQSIRDNQIGPMYEYTWPHIERVTTVENIFVTLAAETGLLGLSAFALLMGISFFIFRRVYKTSEDQTVKVLALSTIAACLAFLLSGMTVANIIGYTISTLFFGVFLASIAILSRLLPGGQPPLLLKNSGGPLVFRRNAR
jgi:O-antigen ligase